MTHKLVNLYICFVHNQGSLGTGFRIRIRKDPHIFESKDPDPQKNADPDPWTQKNAEKMEKST